MARILVIEDDQVMRSVVSKYLKHVGYDVVTASNGLEGVEVFRSCPDLVDLVLTDLRMPVMTGNEAVHQIREMRPDAKVICMTDSSEDVRLNGVPVLGKPFSLKTLYYLISHLLQLKYGEEPEIGWRDHAPAGASSPGSGSFTIL